MGREGCRRGVAKDVVELLLVDSEVEFRQAAARALQGRGFRVAQADGSERALALIRDSPPEAVVLDVGKDGTSSLSLLARIRAADPRVPVIMLTEEGET